MAREFVNTSLYNDANLVAYYKLEDVNDSKGSYTLTNNGTVTFSAGKFNNGANFVAASDQYLSTTNTLGIDGGACSYSMWVNFASTPSSNNAMALSYQANNTSKTEYLLQYYNDAGTLKLWFDRAKPGVGDQTATYTTTLSTSTWYHVVMTYDGTNLKGYLNGTEVATVAASGNGSSNGTEGFRLGRRYNETTNDLNGMIDDVAIFSRALTASEVKSIYTSRTFQKDTNNSLNVGLVSYYKLGDTTDFYGGYNGTATNVTFGTGKVNNGATFSAASSSKILTNTPCNITSTSPFSMAGWFNLSNTTAGYLLCSNFAGAGSLFFDINKDGYVSNKVTFEIGKTGTGVTHIEAGTNYTTGTWEFYAVTYDGAGNMKLYRNADTVVTGTYSNGSATSSGANLGIGYATNNTNYITGSIDEVGFWSKALSTTEISDLYNSGNGQTMNPPIEFDAASSESTVGSATSLNHNHTVGTGSNRIMFAGVMNATNSTDNISTVTAIKGGSDVAMTRLTTSTPTSRFLALYVLDGVDTGTNTVKITTSSSVQIDVSVWVYYGAKQTTTSGDFVFAQSIGSGTSWSQAVTTAVDNSWVTSVSRFDSATSAGTNTIQRLAQTNYTGIYDSSLNPISPTASTTINVTGSNVSHGGIVVSFAPYVASTDLSVNLSDSITISENISTRIDFNINLNDAVTVTENITSSNPDLGGISVSDSITITELVQTISPYEILVFDSVSVSENITSIVPDLGNISVNDAITITESTSMTISDPRRGVIYLNSMAQSFPIPMDSNKQNRPLPMDDTRTL